MAAPTRRSPPPRRPAAVTALGGLQFVVAAAVVIVLLGDGYIDGELGGADYVRAVVAAIIGAAIVGATWSGGRLAWWAQLVLATLAVLWGGITLALDDPPGAPVLVVGVLWLALAILPTSREWFLRPLP